MSLSSRIDHVAIAVADWDAGLQRWEGRLGGGPVSGSERDGFYASQLRYCNGTKLELMSRAPSGAKGFIGPFLDRFGSTVHHITLKVPDVADAVRQLADAGVAAVDVDIDRTEWHESFISPRITRGPIVQVAWTSLTDEEWSVQHGRKVEPPRSDGARFRGAILEHPDLEEASRLWSLLGADVEFEGGWLVCSWGPEDLRVWIRRGDGPPIGLVFEGPAGPLPADDLAGPAVYTALPDS